MTPRLPKSSLSFVPALALIFVATSAFAQKKTAYKHAEQFDCAGTSFAYVKDATAEDYLRLDRELTYANDALQNPMALQGTWVHRTLDEENRLVTNTVEFQTIKGVLHSRLINWGGRNAVIDFTPVKLNTERAYLELDYPWSTQKIQMRPISATQMRYAFSDQCAINFPTEGVSPVFEIKAAKKSQSLPARGRRRI